MTLLCLKFYSLRIKSDLSLTPKSPSQSAISTCVTAPALSPARPAAPCSLALLNVLVMLALVSDLPTFPRAHLCLVTPLHQLLFIL